ncbi:hypothetical protein D1P53_003017 [Cryptococcus gattii VGV]|nr:hypothetical protein D1P53_003017 [Cryptococcus gattii VGV]
MAGGPYAHWWYGTDLDTRSESIWALKHAIGTSLGSIAFGSLLVTAIEVLHFVLKLLSGGNMGKISGFSPARLRDTNGDSAAAFSLSWKIGSNSLINTSSGFETSALQLTNLCAFLLSIRIGVDRFEIGFIQGGKEVWRLFKKGRKLKRQGIAALVNDSVVGLALHVSCIGNAVLCAGLSYLYMTMINGSFNIDHWWDW